MTATAYIVETHTQDHIWGDSVQVEVRPMRNPPLMVPYAVRVVESFAEGVALAKEHGYKAVCLRQHNRRDKVTGLYSYGKPEEVTPS